MEEVDSYVSLWLGQGSEHHNLQLEIVCRSAAGWRKFQSIIDVSKPSSPEDHASFFNTTVLKELTYWSETWSPTKGEENVLGMTERVMEWKILGIRHEFIPPPAVPLILLQNRHLLREPPSRAWPHSTLLPILPFYLSDQSVKKKKHLICNTKKPSPFQFRLVEKINMNLPFSHSAVQSTAPFKYTTSPHMPILKLHPHFNTNSFTCWPIFYFIPLHSFAIPSNKIKLLLSFNSFFKLQTSTDFEKSTPHFHYYTLSTPKM